MRIHNRVRFRALASIGAVALAGSMAFAGAANATQTIPAYPSTSSFGTAPLFQNTSQNASYQVRSVGSDTTLFMMQTIGDLYNDAGLYGCTLETATGGGYTEDQSCNPTGNTTTTDVIDNFMRTEISNGINNIGSGAGQEMLCGYLTSPDPVDFARSSKPPSAGNCPSGTTDDMVGLGYAKDSVPAVDFPTLSPGLVGAASAYENTGSGTIDNGSNSNGPVYAPANIITADGIANLPALPDDGVIGPVAAGWLPGNPTNCVAAGSGLSGTVCSGTPFTDIEGGNSTVSGGGTSSVAYRIFCDNSTNRIYDWGQLTNLSSGQVPGQGTPIGVPIRVVDVNTGSGTAYTFAQFSNSGTGNATCAGSSTQMDINAASGPNPFTNDGPVNNQDMVVENNASQIGAVAAADFQNDPADQAFEIATSLYFISFGVAQTNTNAKLVSLSGAPSAANPTGFGNAPAACTGSLTTDCVPSGVPTTYAIQEMKENTVAPSIIAEQLNNYPTSRTLYNIYRTSTIRASTGGFMNWICDNNQEFQKATDLVTGTPYDSLLTSIIQNQYGFLRLTDSTTELPATKVTAPDGLGAPNATCDAQISVTSNGTNVVTYNGSTTAVPGGVHVNAAAATESVASGGETLPSGTTIQSISGNQITLSNAVTGSGSFTLYLPGTAPVLQVNDKTT